MNRWTARLRATREGTRPPEQGPHANLGPGRRTALARRGSQPLLRGLA